MPSSSLLESRPVATNHLAERQIRASARQLAHPSLFLFVILAAQMMVTLDATVVNVALPHIQRALGFSATSLSWVIDAYVLTFGGLLLLGARAGDLVGRRRIFLVGVTVFSLSSLAGGFATTSWMLLAARSFQGVGAALAAPSSLALLTTVFSEGPARTRAIGLFTAVATAGGAIGLVLGGVLTEWYSWRWVMFINVPIGITVFLAGRFVLAETERRHGHFDLLGAITSTFGTSGIVLGLVEAGSSGWTRALTFVPLLLGAALLSAFFWHEGRAEEPILPIRLLKSPVRNAANLARGLIYAGMFGMFFFITQFLQDLQGYSPLRTGVSFLALPSSLFLSSQLTSRVLSARIAGKNLMLVGIGLSTLGLLFATRLHADATYPQVLVSLVLLGAGTGISLVSLTSASLAGVEPGEAGAASGLINVAQQVGAALGLAAIVTVFGNVTHHEQLVSPRGVVAATARTLLVHGFDEAFAAGAVFGLLAFTLVAIVIRPLGEAAEVSVPDAAMLIDEDVSL